MRKAKVQPGLNLARCMKDNMKDATGKAAVKKRPRINTGTLLRKKAT